MERTDTDALVARLGELLAKATKGPWNLQPDGHVWGDDHPIAEITDGRWGDWGTDITTGKTDLVHHWGTVDAVKAHANTRLIVEAINALPTLIATIESLQARVAEAEGVIEPFARVAAAFDYWIADVMPSLSFPIDGTDLTLANQDCPAAICSLDEQDFRAAANFLSGKGAGG